MHDTKVFPQFQPSIYNTNIHRTVSEQLTAFNFVDLVSEISPEALTSAVCRRSVLLVSGTGSGRRQTVHLVGVFCLDTEHGKPWAIYF